MWAGAWPAESSDRELAPLLPEGLGGTENRKKRAVFIWQRPSQLLTLFFF